MLRVKASSAGGNDTWQDCVVYEPVSEPCPQRGGDIHTAVIYTLMRMLTSYIMVTMMVFLHCRQFITLHTQLLAHIVMMLLLQPSRSTISMFIPHCHARNTSILEDCAATLPAVAVSVSSLYVSCPLFFSYVLPYSIFHWHCGNGTHMILHACAARCMNKDH